MWRPLQRQGTSLVRGTISRIYSLTDLLISRTFSKHQDEKHGDRQYTCDNSACSAFSTSSLRSFRRHLDTAAAHVTDKTPQFWCICGYKERRKDHYRRHLDKKRPCKKTGQPYKCLCNSVFEDIETLKEHYERCGQRKRGRPRKDVTDLNRNGR
jgi:hypothetical protein